MVGMTLFAGVSALVAEGMGPVFRPFSSDDYVFLVPLAVVLVGGQFSVRAMANKQREALKQETQLEKKLYGFRSLCIMKYGMLEGPGLFAIACVMLTGNAWFYVVTAACLLGMVLLRPTPDRAVTTLDLSAAERAVVYDPGALIE